MRLALAVEGYRRRRGGFPETLNAENLRLEAAVCRDPYSGQLFEYSSSAGEYVLRAAPFWERSEGGIFAVRFGLAFSGAQRGLCGSGRMNRVGFPLRFKRPWRQIFRRSEFGVSRCFGWGSSPKYLE